MPFIVMEQSVYLPSSIPRVKMSLPFVPKDKLHSALSQKYYISKDLARNWADRSYG